MRKFDKKECDCCHKEFTRVYFRYKGRKKYQFCADCVESMYWTDICLWLDPMQATPGLTDFERESKNITQLVVA